MRTLSAVEIDFAEAMVQLMGTPTGLEDYERELPTVFPPGERREQALAVGRAAHRVAGKLLAERYGTTPERARQLHAMQLAAGEMLRFTWQQIAVAEGVAGQAPRRRHGGGA